MSFLKRFRQGESQYKRPAKPKVDFARAYARKLTQDEVASAQDAWLDTTLVFAIMFGGGGALLYLIGPVFGTPVTMSTRAAIIVIVCALAIIPLLLLKKRLQRNRRRAEEKLVTLIREDDMSEPEEPEKEPFPEQQRTYVDLSEAGGWPAGDILCYECLRCGDILPSLPEEYRECYCGNVFIDPDAGRFSAGDEQLIRAFLLEPDSNAAG